MGASYSETGTCTQPGPVSGESATWAFTLLPARFNAFHPDTHKPMHRECGFIRLKPDTNKVAFVSAQNTGTVPGRPAPCPRASRGVASARGGICVPPATLQVTSGKHQAFGQAQWGWREGAGGRGCGSPFPLSCTRVFPVGWGCVEGTRPGGPHVARGSLEVRTAPSARPP